MIGAGIALIVLAIVGWIGAEILFTNEYSETAFLLLQTPLAVSLWGAIIVGTIMAVTDRIRTQAHAIAAVNRALQPTHEKPSEIIVGSVVRQGFYGLGVVRDYSVDGRLKIDFENGATQRYSIGDVTPV